MGTGSSLVESKIGDVIEKYEIHWSGNAVKRQHGVGVAILVDNNIDIIEVIPVNARIIVLKVVVHGCLLKIINCYAPTEDATESAKNVFYQTLYKQFKNIGKEKVICLGDYNATTSAAWYNSCLREKTVIENLEVNNNGERFHLFFNSQCLSVLNTWFTHKRCRRITWHSGDNVTKKVYDFILCCSWLRQYVSNCRVYNSYDFDSDHCLAVAHLNTPCTKVARHITRTMKKKKKCLDLASLNQPEIQFNFINAAVENLKTLPLNTTTNNEINNHLVNAINTAGNDTLPLRENERNIPPWHNDEVLEELYNRRDQLRKENATRKIIAVTTKKIRKRASFLRDEYFKMEAEKINQFAINRELDKLFSKAKRQQTTFKSVPDVCPADKILEHFKAHFNPDNPADIYTPDELGKNLPMFIKDLQQVSRKFSINDHPPTVNEIQDCLKQLKINKASNDIAPELLKRCEHPIMIEALHRMTRNLWEEMDIPTAWGNSRLKTLWKGKGSKKDPQKHRGLSIGSTVCKLIINIILGRLRLWYESQLADEQNGFRQDRGTTDGTFTVKRVQQITDRKKQPLYLLFVDLTAAFDHITRKWLFDSIRLRFPEGENLKLFTILENLYKNTSLTYEEANATFETTSGVRQGGPESPFLFNLFIDFVMRVFMDRCAKDKNIKFFEHKYRFNGRTISREERLNFRKQNVKLSGSSILPWCGYADDLILFLIDKTGLQKASIILDEVFTTFGLSINVLKTETMIINHKCLQSNEYPSSIVTLKDKPLNNVKEFKYLGSYLYHNEPSTGDIELNHRIQMANGKFSELLNLFQNYKINLHTRIKFLNSFVRSRLTYSCQNWNIKSSQYERIDVVYRLFLRRMVRGGFRHCTDVDNQFKFKLSNYKIHNLCNTSDVSNFIKGQQNNYAAHLIRTSRDRSTKKLLFNDDKYTKVGRVVPSLLVQVVHNKHTTIDEFCNYAISKKEHGNRL